MLIKLVGNGPELDTLAQYVRQSLDELALSDATRVEITDDATYKLDLGITENPALCIEEESIDFRDMIFQGELPEYAEIKSMFISILGDEEESGGCGTCSTGGCDTCGDTDTSCATECDTDGQTH